MHSGQLGCVFNWTFSYTVMFFFRQEIKPEMKPPRASQPASDVIERANRSSTPTYVHFCHAMLCKRGLCCRAVCVCLYVCVSVTFVHSVKTTKHIFKCFSPSGSHTILVFPYQTAWQYSDGKPTNGGVECRWGRQKSRFWANNGSSGKCNTLSCDRPRRVYNKALRGFSATAEQSYL